MKRSSSIEQAKEEEQKRKKRKPHILNRIQSTSRSLLSMEIQKHYEN